MVRCDVLRRFGGHVCVLFFFKQKTAYEIPKRDWSSDVCSSDLYAVLAVERGTFSLWQAGMQFVWSGVGGIAVGLALAWLLIRLQRRIEDPPIEITLSFLAPYTIYLLAQHLQVTGVLPRAA